MRNFPGLRAVCSWHIVAGFEPGHPRHGTVPRPHCIAARCIRGQHGGRAAVGFPWRRSLALASRSHSVESKSPSVIDPQTAKVPQPPLESQALSPLWAYVNRGDEYGAPILFVKDVSFLILFEILRWTPRACWLDFGGLGPLDQYVSLSQQQPPPEFPNSAGSQRTRCIPTEASSLGALRPEVLCIAPFTSE